MEMLIPMVFSLGYYGSALIRFIDEAMCNVHVILYCLCIMYV